MATRTRPMFSMNAGQVTGTYSFDDVTLRMIDVTIANTGSKGVVGYKVFNVDDGSLAISGSVKVGDQPKVSNLFPLNILMRQPGPDGDDIWPPFSWQVTFSPL